MPPAHISEAASSEAVLTRSRILDRLAQRVERGQSVALIVVKVSGVKVQRGDELLQAMADRLLAAINGRGSLGEMGGNVFLAVPDSDLSPAAVSRFANELARTDKEPVTLGPIVWSPRLSIGTSHAPAGEGNVDDALMEASEAMRAARRSRSSHVAMATAEIRAVAHRRAVVDRDLLSALQTNAVTFEFQPVVKLATGEIHGGEALMRWEHPELGPVAPECIMERVQALDLTRKFTAWAVESLTGSWSEMLAVNPDLADLTLAINLNERQLADSRCVASVLDAIDSHGLPRSSVIIEVGESGRIGEFAETSLETLAEAGCSIMLDDFGTGFNALEYFLRFPVHGIKFDRSLIHGMGDNATARAILEGVATVAHRLGVVTVAEGIETAEDIDLCDELELMSGQGWHFSSAQTIAEFAESARASRQPR